PAGARRHLLARRGAHRRFDGAPLAVANITDAHRRTDSQQRYPHAQIIRVTNLAAVDSDDHVPGLESRTLGSGARLDLRDERAVLRVEIERFGERRRHGLDIYAEPAAADLAVLDQLIHHAAGHVRRYREADADVTARRRN